MVYCPINLDAMTTASDYKTREQLVSGATGLPIDHRSVISAGQEGYTLALVRECYRAGCIKASWIIESELPDPPFPRLATPEELAPVVATLRGMDVSHEEIEDMLKSEIALAAFSTGLTAALNEQ